MTTGFPFFVFRDYFKSFEPIFYCEFETTIVRGKEGEGGKGGKEKKGYTRIRCRIKRLGKKIHFLYQNKFFNSKNTGFH